MKILMLGWEFPPFFAGGVGIACYELTKAMSKYNDLEISYIMPYGPDEKKLSDKFKIMSANSPKSSEFDDLVNVNIKRVSSMLYAYDGPEQYSKRLKDFMAYRNIRSLYSPDKSIREIYGSNLIEEVYLYAQRVLNLCKNMDFDVIHAHDWTTFPAAILLKELTGKPAIVHVHITELDKTGGQGGHEEVFKIERAGFAGADKLIAVSEFTKRRLIENYGVNGSKIEVIHNGGISDLKSDFDSKKSFECDDKIVLFAGRVTLQKGPEYFVKAAKKVLEYEPHAKFILAGTGELLPNMVYLVEELGMQDNFFVLGRPYTREEANKFYSMADIFVMPSVSEPFGIVPLEAVAKGTPTIISNQSGISEVLSNAFKVDFWDVDEIAHKIISLLKYPHLSEHMRKSAMGEFESFSWDYPASKVVDLYKRTMH